MSIRAYCYWQIAILAVDCIFVAAWQLVSGDYAVVPAAMLGGRLLVDLVFILQHAHRIRLSMLEWGLVGWVMLAAFVGGVNWLRGVEGYSLTRAVKDTLPALFFFGKLGIFRILPLNVTAPLIVRFTLVISLANLLTYFAFGGFSLGHVGLTPPIKYAVAWYLAGLRAIPLLLCFAILAVSGKRAFFLSAGLYAVATILAGLRQHILSRGPWRLLLGFLLALIAVATIPSPIQRKIETTFAGLQDGLRPQEERTEAAGNSSFYTATAGRSAEIEAIWAKMDTHSIVLGKGAGFTYALELADGVVIESYANVHFSPLGLCYKYGTIFTVAFYGWMLLKLFPRRRAPQSREPRFWRGVGFLIVAESFFAFNLFVEPLLPLALVACWKRDNPQKQA